jgi:hypothetical protein
MTSRQRRVAVLATISLSLAPTARGGEPPESPPGAAPPSATIINLRIVADQAEAALAILDKRAAGQALDEADWQRLRDTEGYQRLKKRQESFGATEFDARERAFLGEAAESLGRREALQETVADWRALDLEAAAARALAYLPAGSTLRGTIYLVIKRATNSFVFEVDTDPAIFLYVDPEIGTAKLANTLAHELHHIGGSRNCAQPEGYNELPPEARDAVDWLSAFGEGLAMLAAAGGPDVDPQAASGATERAAWQRDLAHFDRDVERLGAFFSAIVRGELSDEERRQQGFSFINTDEVPQGAFYTVGWKMAAEIERRKGHEMVVAAVCDPRILLTAYNEVTAGAPGDSATPPWRRELIDRLYGSRPVAPPRGAESTP